MPDSGAPSDFDTLTEVLAHYAELGFDGNFTITDEGMVRCPACRTEVAPERLVLHGLRRMEGASDPADMLAVLVIECPRCGQRGTAVAHFGPEATEAEATVLMALEDRRLRDGGVEPGS